MVALVVALLSSRAGAGPARRPVGRTYVVQAGDTVWGIARRSVGVTGDPRPVVDFVIRENGLKDAALFPGERLVLPSPHENGAGS